MNRLFLLRHGENQANLTKEFSCREVDYPLNEKGRLQALQAGRALLGNNIRAIVSSPLKRAVETAEIVGRLLNLTPIITEAFREVNVGDLEAQPPTKENWAIHHAIFTQWAAGKDEVAFPAGENYRQLCERTLNGFLTACRHFPNQNILIVGHGGIFTAVLPRLCPGLALSALLQSKIDNASISEVLVKQRTHGLTGELVSFSRSDHLTGSAADLVSELPDKGMFT